MAFGEEVGERFWAKVQKTDDCWLWTAGQAGAGYGQFSVRGTHVYAHRWSYEQAKGAIPEGLVIDHLCRNRLCVRPSHLEAVTQRTNVLRGETLPAQEVALTHCLRGHEFTPENTRITPTGTRACRPCRAAGERARRASLREVSV